MAYIETIDEEEAGGSLAREYEAARSRAGRVFNVVKIQSPSPAAMRDSIGLYKTLMHGRSPLSRAERELMAVVVSVLNDCHY